MAKLRKLLTKENIVFAVCVAAMIAALVVMRPIWKGTIDHLVQSRPPVMDWWNDNITIVFNNTIGE